MQPPLMRSYLQSFLLITITVAAVLTGMDVFERFFEHPKSWELLVFGYFPLQMMAFALMVLPFCSFVSIAYVTARRVSFGRADRLSELYWFCLATGVLFTIIQWNSQHHIIPQTIAKQKAYFLTRIVPDQQLGYISYYPDSDSKLFIRRFNFKRGTAIDFKYDRYENGRLFKRVRASKATCKGHFWQLEKGEIITYHEKGVIFNSFKADGISFELEVTPQQLLGAASTFHRSTTEQIRPAIHFEKRFGKPAIARNLSIEIASRTAYPFSALILTFLGFLIASRPLPGGVIVPVFWSIAMSFVYFFMLAFMRSLIFNFDLPIAWTGLPNMIFSGLIAYLFVQKNYKPGR